MAHGLGMAVLPWNRSPVPDAIDVFSPEPPLPDDLLLSLPNVMLTAHAGFMTPEATMTMLRRALDIVIAADR